MILLVDTDDDIMAIDDINAFKIYNFAETYLHKEKTFAFVNRKRENRILF